MEKIMLSNTAQTPNEDGCARPSPIAGIQLDARLHAALAALEKQPKGEGGWTPVRKLDLVTLTTLRSLGAVETLLSPTGAALARVTVRGLALVAKGPAELVATPRLAAPLVLAAGRAS